MSDKIFTLKILLASHDGFNYFGGPYEWAKRIGKEWRNRGYEVIYTILSDHPKPKSSLYQYVVKRGFKAYHLRRHTLTQRHDNTEDRIEWFSHKAKIERPDVFIANITLEALYACQAIEKLGVKTFGIYHSDDDRHLWLNDLFVQQRKYGPTNMVFVSQLLKSKFADGQPNSFVIGCGTEVHPHAQAKYSNSPLKIVYAGKLTIEQKQIYKQLNAFELISSYFSEQVQIDIYGAGPESHKIKTQYSDHPQINYKGFISSDKILEIFANYQVFVLLSDYEGLPIALMEAMSVGLIPICLDIKSGIPELIDHGVNGFIIPNRKEAFVNAVKSLLLDSDKWNTMSLNAQQKITHHYSTKAIADKWDAAFKDAEIHRKNKAFQLPTIHPLLLRSDVRKPSFYNYCKQQLNRVKRNLTTKQA